MGKVLEMRRKADFRDKTDYIYCEDCKEYIDFFQYDHSIEDAGHKDCDWRYVNAIELKGCIADCKEMGCLL